MAREYTTALALDFSIAGICMAKKFILQSSISSVQTLTYRRFKFHSDVMPLTPCAIDTAARPSPAYGRSHTAPRIPTI